MESKTNTRIFVGLSAWLFVKNQKNLVFFCISVGKPKKASLLGFW